MTDDRHSEHDEHPDLDGCTLCRAAFEEAYAEHAWMGRAVKTWTGGNPYAPDREGQPEFNGAFR